MNRLTHPLRLLIVFVSLLLGCSCTQPDSSHASIAVVPQSITYANAGTPPTDPTPTPNVSEAEAYLSGEVAIITIDQTEKNSRFAYDLDVHYPQIANPSTRNHRRFNSHVRSLVEKDIRLFRAYCAKNNKYRNGKRREMEYHFGLDYEVFFVTAEIVSIKLTLESFTGYLNSDWFPIPINYDLKTGKPLVLADIFKPKSKFLKVIADYCVTEFMERGLNCGGGGVGSEPWMREGTEPKTDNYASWNLTRHGLQLNFGEYQVGPGCLGLVNVVVPYDHLRAILLRENGLQVNH